MKVIDERISRSSKEIEEISSKSVFKLSYLYKYNWIGVNIDYRKNYINSVRTLLFKKWYIIPRMSKINKNCPENVNSYS